jgi:hypothetical protein
MAEQNQINLFTLYKDAQADARERLKLELERERIALEFKKFELEQTKMRLEERKLAASVLIEDFKARWQELLNFENENNRWSTLYVTALLLVISWILNNGSKYNGLSELFQQNENSYFILSIALINAIYTLSMAIKGYQVQQIALYLYERIGSRVTELTGEPFNCWESYRRMRFQKEQKGKPEPVRRIYYGLIGMLPTIVSATILFLYYRYEWHRQADIHGWWSIRNWTFMVVSIMVAASLWFAISTTSLIKEWKLVLNKKGNPCE